MFQPVKQRHNKALIIGGGESLKGFDFGTTENFPGAIITVNRVIEHLPRADYWISIDLAKPQRPLEEQRENCYYYAGYPTIETEYNIREGVHYLEKVTPGKGGDYSLQEDKTRITGGDSMYAALGLAYHMEAKEIIILGMDCYGYGHWYDSTEPYNGYQDPKFEEKHVSRLPGIYQQSTKQLEERGVRVINGSPKSKIDCFPRTDPKTALNYFEKNNG